MRIIPSGSNDVTYSFKKAVRAAVNALTDVKAPLFGMTIAGYESGDNFRVFLKTASQTGGLL